MNDEKNTQAGTPLISVVIPVYKAEAYLARCVESVRGQTYRNLEIILVDDGSPDNCPALCDAYAAQDARIRVIHKPNGGPAEARNMGTEAARGAYVSYVDSDDWADRQMLERLYTQLCAYDAEIAVGYLQETDGTSRREAVPQPAQCLTGGQAMEQLLYQRKIDSGPCCKLYPIALARQFPYPAGKLYEDLFTTYKIFFAAAKAVILPEELYCYHIHENSIMRRDFDLRMFDELDAADEIEAFVRQNCPQYLPAARARKFSAYSQVLRWMPAEKQAEEIEQKRRAIWAFLAAYRWQMARDKNARAKNRAAALATLLGPRLFAKL